PGEAGGVDVAAFEEVGARADRAVVAEETRAVEEEAYRVLVAERAGDARAERGDAVGADVEEAGALGAHQPLVGAGGEVVDAGGARVEGDRADGLDGVDEELGAGGVAEGGHGLDGHAEAGLELDGA